MSVLRNHEICRLCLHYIKDDSDIKIDTYYLDLENEKVSLKRAFAVCLPEVDLTKTVQQHICSSCLSNVITLYKVKRYINESEERVLKYFAENKLIRRSAQIDLNCIITEDDELQYIVDTIDETFRSVVCLINQEKLDEKIKKMCAIKNITFRCFVCEYETTDYHLLKRHYVRRHSKTVEVVIDELFHEPKPETATAARPETPTASRPDSADRASATPSPTTSYKCACDGCDYSTVWAKEMRYHKSCHLKNYLCFTCKNAYVTPKYVQWHGRGKHKTIVMVECKYCSYATAEPEDALDHFDSSHGNEDINVLMSFDSGMTSLTDELNSALDERLSSIGTRSRNSSSSNNEKFTQCPSCPFKSYSITVLQNHKKKVHPAPVPGPSTRKRNRSASPVPRVSELRGQTAKKKTAAPSPVKKTPLPAKSSLVNTVKKPDVPKSANPFGCLYCSRSFKTVDMFKSHFEKSHPNKPIKFKCNHCPHIASRKLHLQTHWKRYHSYQGLAPKVQTAPSTVRRIVKRNATTVVEESDKGQTRLFVCDPCKRKFKNLSRLIEHRFVHSKPYECPCCGIETSSVSNIRSHFGVHHPSEEIRLKCRWCDFTTDGNEEWNKHFATLHRYTEPHLGEELFKYCQENNIRGRLRAKHKTSGEGGPGPHNTRSRLNRAGSRSNSVGESADGRSSSRASNVEACVGKMEVKVFVEKLTEEEINMVIKDGKTARESSITPTPPAAPVTEVTPAPEVAPAPEVTPLPNIAPASEVTPALEDDAAPKPDIEAASENRENSTETSKPATNGTSTGPIVELLSRPIHTLEDAFSKRYKAPIVEVICYECDVDGCEYRTAVKGYYERHKQSHKKLKFKCVTCKEKFPMMRQLDEHSKVHADSPVLKCCFCSFGNKEHSVLVRHYTNRHSKYKARELQYAMVPMEERSRRWNSVEVKGDPDTLIGTVTCSLCGLKAPENQLPQHLLQHLKFPFLCIICERTFSHRRKLIKHVYEHQKPEDGNSAETKSEIVKSDQNPEREGSSKCINPVSMNLKPLVKEEAPGVAGSSCPDNNIPVVVKTEPLEIYNTITYSCDSAIVVADDDD